MYSIKSKELKSETEKVTQWYKANLLIKESFYVRRRLSNIHDWDSIRTVVQELKSEKDKVTQWYKVNLLKANPSKYQIIAIDPKSS